MPGSGADGDEIHADKRARPSLIDPPLTKPQPTPRVIGPTVDLGVYRYWLSAIGILPLVLYVVLVVGNGFFSNFPNIWVKLWSADSRIVSASQEPVFLPDGTTLRVHLDPWGQATDAECAAVLSELDLSPLLGSGGGLATPFAGVDLSGGQKQLFSLARAVLRRRVKMRETRGNDGGLLLLDEITSAADRETEEKVGRVVETEFGGWTVVMVTHRVAAVVGGSGWWDRVVVLDTCRGVVVEDGPPGELVLDAFRYGGFV